MSFSEKLGHESCVANTLSESEMLTSVSILRRVCESCIGPHGSCQLIHNDVGGHVVVTSAAERLFSASQVASPVLRLLISAIQRHVSMHSDGASTTAVLSLFMTERALLISLQQKRSLVVDLLDVIVEAATMYLSSDQCTVCRTLQLDNLDDLLQLLRGVLSTKPVSGMSRADVECVACCMLKTILNQLTHGNDNFASVLALGHAVHSSYVQSGTLLEASHLPAYSVTEQHESDTTSVTRTTRSLMTGLRQHYTDTASQQSSADSITVAMYSVSLVGSWDDNDDIADSVELGPDVDVDKFIIDRLLATAQTVVDSGARVLACQKVVHPRVKRFVRSRGVLVLDRLGHSIARQLAWQTGAQLITAPFAPVCTDQLGRLADVSHQIINQKSYVCFDGGPRPVHTLVLCAVTEEAGQELKQVSNAAYRVLVQALRERVALVGGGVWQNQLADYVRDLGRQRSVELSDRFGCRRCDVVNVSECVADALQRVAQLIQPQALHHHQHQQQPQEVDMTSSERTEVLDMMSSCVNGLKTAVSMTQSLLKLQFQSTSALS